MQRHTGGDVAILVKRKEVYEKAKRENPQRWSGDTRNWDRITTVILNLYKEMDRLQLVQCDYDSQY